MQKQNQNIKIVPPTTDSIVMQHTNIFHTLANQIHVGTLLLRNDFSLLQYNSVALGYIKQFLSCQASEREFLTSNETQEFSVYLLRCFHQKGLEFSLDMPNYGSCYVVMAPFIYTSENIAPNTYYCVCMTDSLKNSSKNIPDTVRKYGLSSREIEVVSLITHGYSNREISESLYISIHTVKTHIENIFRKLEVKNRADLVRFFLHNSPPC